RPPDPAPRSRQPRPRGTPDGRRPDPVDVHDLGPQPPAGASVAPDPRPRRAGDPHPAVQRRAADSRRGPAGDGADRAVAAAAGSHRRSAGEQLTVSVVRPGLGLMGLGLRPQGRIAGGPAVAPAAAATSATALTSPSSTPRPILTGFDRRNGVLRWLATSPLGEAGTSPA